MVEEKNMESMYRGRRVIPSNSARSWEQMLGSNTRSLKKPLMNPYFLG